MRLAVPLLAMMVGIAPVARAAAPDLAAIRALQAQSQWAASESLATAALADLAKQPKTDSLAIAEASYLAGVAHMRQTGYADGVALNDGLRARDIRARRLGWNTPPVAEAELLIGRALQGADHTDSALVHLKRAVDIYSATLAPKDTLVAEAWNQLALCHRDRREIREALDAWNQAIAARTLADGADSPAVALLQAQTGACWMELADFGRAREVLEGSLATFAKIGANDHPSRWVPLNILADLEARQGNYARDVDLLQESYRIVRLNFGDDSRQALTLRGNLATAFALMRDYGGAIALLQPLIPAYAAQYGATSSRTLNLQFLLAGAQAQITPGDAGLRRYTEIESLLAANPGPVRALLGTAYQQHAEQLQRRRRFSEALAMCDSAERSENARRTPSAQILAQTEYERVYSYVGLGDTAGLTRSRARLDQLRARYGSNLPVLPGTFQYFCAYADWKRGQADTAWSEALDCDQRNRESLRINLGRLSDRRSLQFAQGTVGEQDLVLSLAGSNPARLETAWDHMVRRRGLMRGELARRATPRGFEGDTAVAGANARWRSAQDRYARLLVRGVAGDSAARASIARAQLEANEAEQAYGDVLSARGAGAVPRDHGLADVRATLRAGQALLSIAINNGWRDSAHVSAFVARAGDPQLHRVELGLYGPLHAAVEAWTAALSTQPPADAKAAARAEADCRKLGAAVSARVWAPLAPLLAQSSEIFIVPDGPVVDLPWPALPVGSKKYFADQGPLMHPLDAEVAMLDSSAANGSGELLAVGAPDFNRTEAPSAPAGPMLAAVVRSAPDPCAAGAPLALPPLPGSGAEVTDILGEWNESRAGATHLLTGASATEQAFKAAAHGCEVIHIATHGVMRGDRCAEGISGARGIGGVAPVDAMPASAGGASGAASPGVANGASAGGASGAASPGVANGASAGGASGVAAGGAPSKKAAALPPSAPASSSAAATADAPSPWLVRRVWLAMAGANHADEHTADDNEGLLTAEEVATLDLAGTDWVVLSACHSGAGDAWSHEGRLGMRRAFALAGARTVIASAWALGDEDTGEWMHALYDARLRQHADATAAIRAADRAMLDARRARKRSTHPFYWAAFSASGR